MADSLCKAGTLLLITSGDGYDTTVGHVVRVVRDFHLRAYRRAYLSKYPRQRARFEFESRQFVAYLFERGLIVEEQYRTLGLPSDGYSYRQVSVG